MRIQHLFFVLASSFCLFFCGCGNPQDQSSQAKIQFVNIGTGGMTGVYYQVGSAMMKLMQPVQDASGIKVSFQSTGGSVYNINAVIKGDITFGVCQADRQYQAVHGEGEWKQSGPQDKLRAVCSLYPEVVTLVASVKSGVQTVDDLKGKRVNIGNPGSGNRGNSLALFEELGIDWKKDIKAEGIKASESAKLLQDGRIDAYFYTVGHPAASIAEACAGRLPVRLVPITGVDAMIAAKPYYTKATIPVPQLYAKAANEAAIESIGMRTTLVASADTPDDVVYTIVKEMFTRIDEFRAMHPAFARLDPQEMVHSGNSAPFHPGALKYFKEANLLK